MLQVRANLNHIDPADVFESASFSQFSVSRILRLLTNTALTRIHAYYGGNALTAQQFVRMVSFSLKQELAMESRLITPVEEVLLGLALLRIWREILFKSKKDKVKFQEFAEYGKLKMTIDSQPLGINKKHLDKKLLQSSPTKQTSRSKNIASTTQLHELVIEPNQMLYPRPFLHDRLIHQNRAVKQVIFSPSEKLFGVIDSPTTKVRLLNSKLQLVQQLQTEQQISKRDAVVTWIVWSERQKRLACLLANFSISFWALEDNYRFEVNIGLSNEKLLDPFIQIGYSQSLGLWYAIDGRPRIHVLKSTNFEPEYVISGHKMIRKLPTEKILTVEMKMKGLLCVGFERSVFLVSLESREVVSQLPRFATGITSMGFCEAYQCLAVSCFQNYATVWQASQFSDLTYKSRLQGHSSQVCLVCCRPDEPVILTLSQTAEMRLWDVRTLSCFQTIQALKNIQYEHMFVTNSGVCLVGSKIYLYAWESQVIDRSSKQLTNGQNTPQANQEDPIKSVHYFQKDVYAVTVTRILTYTHPFGELSHITAGIFTSDTRIVCSQLLSDEGILVICGSNSCMVALQTPKMHEVFRIQLNDFPIKLIYDGYHKLLTVAMEKTVRICLWKQLLDGISNRNYQPNTPTTEQISKNRAVPKSTQAPQISPPTLQRPIKSKRLIMLPSVLTSIHISPANNIILITLVGKDGIWILSYERGKEIERIKWRKGEKGRMEAVNKSSRNNNKQQLGSFQQEMTVFSAHFRRIKIYPPSGLSPMKTTNDNNKYSNLKTEQAQLLTLVTILDSSTNLSVFGVRQTHGQVQVGWIGEPSEEWNRELLLNRREQVGLVGELIELPRSDAYERSTKSFRPQVVLMTNLSKAPNYLTLKPTPQWSVNDWPDYKYNAYRLGVEHLKDEINDEDAKKKDNTVRNKSPNSKNRPLKSNGVTRINTLDDQKIITPNQDLLPNQLKGITLKWQWHLNNSSLQKHQQSKQSQQQLEKISIKLNERVNKNVSENVNTNISENVNRNIKMNKQQTVLESNKPQQLVSSSIYQLTQPLANNNGIQLVMIGQRQFSQFEGQGQKGDHKKEQDLLQSAYQNRQRDQQDRLKQGLNASLFDMSKQIQLSSIVNRQKKKYPKIINRKRPIKMHNTFIGSLRQGANGQVMAVAMGICRDRNAKESVGDGQQASEKDNPNQGDEQNQSLVVIGWNGQVKGRQLKKYNSVKDLSLISQYLNQQIYQVSQNEGQLPVKQKPSTQSILFPILFPIQSPIQSPIIPQLFIYGYLSFPPSKNLTYWKLPAFSKQEADQARMIIEWIMGEEGEIEQKQQNKIEGIELQRDQNYIYQSNYVEKKGNKNIKLPLEATQPSQLSLKPKLKSTSLRETKHQLQKHREQLNRQQNYLLYKMKMANNNGSYEQAKMSEGDNQIELTKRMEIMEFFNVGRADNVRAGGVGKGGEEGIKGIRNINNYPNTERNHSHTETATNQFQKSQSPSIDPSQTPKLTPSQSLTQTLFMIRNIKTNLLRTGSTISLTNTTNMLSLKSTHTKSQSLSRNKLKQLSPIKQRVSLGGQQIGLRGNSKSTTISVQLYKASVHQPLMTLSSLGQTLLGQNQFGQTQLRQTNINQSDYNIRRQNQQVPSNGQFMKDAQLVEQGYLLQRQHSIGRQVRRETDEALKKAKTKKTIY